MASEKEEIILDFKVEQGDALKELEQTKVAIINLKKEQADLNKAYKNGEKSTEEYAQELVKLEGELKKNNKAYNDNLKAINGVKTKFDELVDGLSSSIPGFQGVSGGFGKITASAKAFIATPIGAVVTALGLALSALTAYFKGSEEGQTKLNRIMNIGSAVVGKFSDIIQSLGKFIFENLIQGFEKTIDFLNKWIPGFEKATEALSNFFNVDTANTISQLQERQVLLNRELITRRDILKEEIEAAKVRAETTKDAKIRAQALQEATDKINELAQKEKELASLNSQIQIEQAKLSNNQIEANDAIEEGKARINQLERERLSQLKEIGTKQLALTEQSIAILEKERDAIVAAHNAEIMREADQVINAAAKEERHQRELQQINERIQAYVSEEELLRRRIQSLDLEADLTDESADANAALAKEFKKLSAAEQFANMVTQVRVNLLNSLGFFISQIAGKNKEVAAAAVIVQRAAAISQITSNTAIANAKAVALSPLTFGQPFVTINTIAGVLSAAGVVADAVSAISQITKAAGGGSFLTKGPQLMMVGDNPGGIERVDVTPISGRGKTSVGDGMIRMAGGGSVVANASSSRIDQSFAAANLFKDMNFSVSWREGNELGDKIRFKEDLTTA